MYHCTSIQLHRALGLWRRHVARQPFTKLQSEIIGSVYHCITTTTIFFAQHRTTRPHLSIVHSDLLYLLQLLQTCKIHTVGHNPSYNVQPPSWPTNINLQQNGIIITSTCIQFTVYIAEPDHHRPAAKGSDFRFSFAVEKPSKI